MSAKTAEEVCKACQGWCCYRFWAGEKDELMKYYPDDADFIRDNFKVLRKHAWAKGCRDQGVTYTCEAYDKVKRICSRHADRPAICRKFVCSPARTGVVPDRRHYPVQARAFRREGVRIVCPDGRSTPRRKSFPEHHDDTSSIPKQCDDIIATAEEEAS